ncbi:MAG TPA: AAA family ATPase [Rhodocyclaceae bacterium]|nr:AAA family ATPase [Rhodocyclaceae bacterium]
MSLYLEHFGLRESPYRITPHTEFFFDGAKRGSTLDALIYAIVHDEGIVKVTGEVGSGKTMLCRMLLERLPKSVETLYFANPSLNRDELLLALADELKLPSPPGQMHQLLRAIQQHLVDLHLAGKQVVLLIDEAHAMPEGSLEEIRLLSNLETQRAKLLQIVLFGQPELNAVLGTLEMRQLRERVTHNFFLEPLKQTDIACYLMFRLRAAGYHGPDIFAPAAIKLFTEVSHGLTRRLNILADKALLAAFAGNTHLIDGRVAKIAIADAQFNDTGVVAGLKLKGRQSILAAGGLALASALLLVGWVTGQNEISTRPIPAETIRPSLIVAAPQAAAAAPTTAAPTAGTQDTNALPAGAAQPQTAAAAETRTAEASPYPLLENHGVRFKHWIANADERHYTIQLLRIEEQRAQTAEDFLRQAKPLAESAELYTYKASTEGQQWIGIVYGDFASANEAERTLAALPSTLGNSLPFVRPIRHLKQ